jgi:hypothetical protein
LNRLGSAAGAALTAVLFAAGAALCLHYGRIGFMPLDQSIVFDGGWRLLCGQVPFRDFTVPAGLTPIALQAVVFRLFGVSWFAYCLHAALLNGLFCVLVFRLLGRLEAGAPAAAFYAFLSGVVFYTPFGVPYMDQHAFFFSLAAVAALVEAMMPGPRRGFWLGLVPWLLAAAYLSKQIPSVLLFPLLGSFPFLLVRRERRSAVRTLATSTIVLAGLLAAATLAVDRSLLAEYFFTLPAVEGGRRLAALLDRDGFAGQAAELTRAARLLALAPTVLGALLLGFSRLRGAHEPDRLPHWLRPALTLYLLAVCAAFVMATDNEGENGVPFVFAAVGLVHAELRARRGGRWRHAPAAMGALVLLSATDALGFNARVNEPRMVHELDGVASAAPRESVALPPALAFMEWRLHPFYRFRPNDLAQVVAHLRSEEGAIYVFGDLTILYALTGRPSAGPALWLHPGLTLPEPEHPGFEAWEERLVDDLERRNVRFVVRESRQTYSGLRLSQFPRLIAYMQAREGSHFSFGPIDVFELRRH